MAPSSYGMTLAGFIPKRLADIQNDMNASIALIVDPATGEYPFQNAADDAILQQIVGVFASALEAAWEAAYEASVQFDPQKNTGLGRAARCSSMPSRARRARGRFSRLILRGRRAYWFRQVP